MHIRYTYTCLMKMSMRVYVHRLLWNDSQPRSPTPSVLLKQAAGGPLLRSSGVGRATPTLICHLRKRMAEMPTGVSSYGQLRSGRELKEPEVSGSCSLVPRL